MKGQRKKPAHITGIGPRERAELSGQSWSMHEARKRKKAERELAAKKAAAKKAAASKKKR